MGRGVRFSVFVHIPYYARGVWSVSLIIPHERGLAVLIELSKKTSAIRKCLDMYMERGKAAHVCFMLLPGQHRPWRYVSFVRKGN